VELHGKAASTPAQMELALKMIRKPAQDPDRQARVWSRVLALKDGYEMSP
jgi:acyl-CoA dehydrogenase